MNDGTTSGPRGSRPAWEPAPLRQVRLAGGLLGERQRTVLDRSIDQQYAQCRDTGRIDALRLAWKPGSELPKPHIFWDSDLAKWIESAAYALTIEPNPALEARVDEVVRLLAGSQQPDGYLNSHYSAVEPDKRFTNLRDCHELYCAGHLVEAAVAYHEATGKREMLDVMCRYVDCIDRTFGPGPGKRRGYDGHEEIELALVRLWKTTGDARHLALAKHFIDVRGTRPYYFDEEARARGEAVADDGGPRYDYFQAHLPVREQATVEGHAVRAMYLFRGAADVAAATGDEELLQTCRRAFANVVDRRMYVTGGVGSTRHGERFTYDFDLPNESAYAETCAAIALTLFARSMTNIERDGRYADAMERALYNGVLSGMSLGGTRYFYANSLAADPRWHEFEGGFPARRQEWFGCACCPPNLARFLASLGTCAYSVGDGELAVNLYAPSEFTFDVGGSRVTVRQETSYPWEGRVVVQVGASAPARWTMRLRVPGWCEGATARVDGREPRVRRGYAAITRTWRDGDRVVLDLPMPVRRVHADPRVRHDAGRVALTRGPLVYCLEEADNGRDLNAISLPQASAIRARHERTLFGGVTTLTAEAVREKPFPGGELYRDRGPETRRAKITAVPYYAWANRGDGEMTVWIRQSR